jgi:hypothetical protein
MARMNAWTLTTLIAAAASFGAGAMLNDSQVDAAMNSGASSCDIKGNVGIETGERIYHVPGQKFYSGTKILPRYGERWFCSEQEAVAAGWRRSKR